MANDIRQSSGVAGGTVDSPRRTALDDRDLASGRTPAGKALANRKHAGVRAKKLAARRKRSARR